MRSAHNVSTGMGAEDMNWTQYASHERLGRGVQALRYTKGLKGPVTRRLTVTQVNESFIFNYTML